jgi:hypothetical protein
VSLRGWSERARRAVAWDLGTVRRMNPLNRFALVVCGLTGLTGCIVDPDGLRITHGFQSVASAPGGQVVMLRVSVHAPTGQTPSFAWTTRSGRLSDPKDTAADSMILWMAPPCPSTESSVDVTATATDAEGLSDSKTFHVGVDCTPTP